MPPGRLSPRWPPSGGGGMMTMATTLCPMCGRPVKLIRGVMAEHRSYSWNVEGTRLRIMWDEGAGPLWGEEGLLPDDPDWLREALGVSDALIADLLAWVRDMDEARDRGQSQALLNPRALQLADRLQTEVGSRFRIRFRP